MKNVRKDPQINRVSNVKYSFLRLSLKYSKYNYYTMYPILTIFVIITILLL